VSDIDTAAADSLEALDLEWPIREADLYHAHLEGAQLSRAKLTWAKLSGANLNEANLSQAQLNEANLSGAQLVFADLSKADLSRANLSGANFNSANLMEASLNDANLSKSVLTGANLRKATLSGANLSGANLHAAILVTWNPRSCGRDRFSARRGPRDGGSPRWASREAFRCACKRGGNGRDLGVDSGKISRPSPPSDLSATTPVDGGFGPEMSAGRRVTFKRTQGAQGHQCAMMSEACPCLATKQTSSLPLVSNNVAQRPLRWRVSGATRASGMRLASFSLRCTAGH
jgi:hypothetical protein